MSDFSWEEEVRPPTLEELVDQVLSAHCWDRFLIKEVQGDLVTIRRNLLDHGDTDYSEMDIVIRISRKSHTQGQVTKADIKKACRAFLLKNDLLT